jgi:hypothetical protein
MPLLLLAPRPAALAVAISPAGVRSLLRPNWLQSLSSSLSACSFGATGTAASALLTAVGAAAAASLPGLLLLVAAATELIAETIFAASSAVRALLLLLLLVVGTSGNPEQATRPEDKQQVQIMKRDAVSLCCHRVAGRQASE